MLQDVPLQPVRHRAKGVVFTEPMKTSWKPPSYILRERTEEENQKIRDQWHIMVEGEDIPPPLKHFKVQTQTLSLLFSSLSKFILNDCFFSGDEISKIDLRSIEKKRHKKTHSHSNSRTTCCVRHFNHSLLITLKPKQVIF